MSFALLSAAASAGSGSRRPQKVPQSPLPPFDSDDPGGVVHTTLPPEQIVPGAFSRDWWRGDIGGVTLKTAPPYVPGANTTPPEMTMSFLLPHYVQFGSTWVDAILTAHAERGYSHFHLDRWNCDAAGLSLSQAVDLFAYVQSWGFYTPYWATGSSDARGGGWPQVQPLIEPFLRALIAGTNPDLLMCLPGEELNNGFAPGPGPTELDPVITNTAAIARLSGIPVWLHFTSNYPAWIPPGPVEGFDQRIIDWIASLYYAPVRGLCWQSNPTDPAGLMGARLWDARRYWSAASNSFLVSAFELRAEAELMGQCDEDHGCLTGWEMICTTRGEPAPNAPAVAGFGNGCRYPNGTAV